MGLFFVLTVQNLLFELRECAGCFSWCWTNVPLFYWRNILSRDSSAVVDNVG